MKIALIQLNNSDNFKGNLKATLGYMAQAVKKGAEILFLPENAAFMTAGLEKYGSREKILSECKSFLSEMQKFAKQNKCWVEIGSLIAGGKTKFLNRSYLINAAGKIVKQYDKVHLFDVKLSEKEFYKESKRFSHGDKLALAATEFGKLGMTICYDLRFPYLFRDLALKGAEIIAVPAAFTYTTGIAHWHILLRARAIENGCFIVAAAQTGEHPGRRKTFGHSLVVNPWGEIVFDAGEKPGAYVTEIDLSQVEKFRRSIPSLKHSRKYAK